MKPIVFFDASIQILKILFSVFALLIFTKESKISGIFIAFFIASFLNLLLMGFVFFRKDKSLLLGNKGKIEKKPVNNYLKFMALAGLALTIFSSIDILMLGKFVSPEYLGYYRVSASLVLTFASLFSLSSIFLPIFTQINKKRFERGVKKTLRYLLMISIPATIGIIFISKYLILLMYGKAYLPATVSLYFLSLIIISTPLVGLYSIILQSKEKAKIVGNVTFIVLFFNIILNYIIIRIFYLNPSQTIAGVGFSTMFSRFILLGILIFISKKEFKIDLKGIGLRSILVSSFILGVFLLIYNYLVDINIIWGIVEVLGGIGVYFVCLILTKGIKKEDFKLLKELKKKIIKTRFLDIYSNIVKNL